MDKDLKRRLNGYNFTLKKTFGQNFISDQTLLTQIVSLSGINSDTVVLEIGCGAGTLTSVLCETCKRVVGYEIDKRLAPIISDTLKDKNNYEIVFKDVMKESLESIEKKLDDNYVLVANLPYYITTPIVMKFLENSTKISAMVVMVQEEVANRFSAKEGSSDYGAITVAINLRGQAEKVLRVGRENFTPVPKVDSAVVKITIDKNKSKNIDLPAVRQTVKAAFSGRRKTLVNNLINCFGLSRENAMQSLSYCNIKSNARGEELSEKQFICLTEYLKSNFEEIYDKKENNNRKRK